MARIKVFISSTQDDLQPERDRVEGVAKDLDFAVVRAETYPQRSTTPRDTVMQMVGECHIYIGILGRRYGTIPTGEPCSVTEMEFDAACALRKHNLLYLKKVEDREPRQQEFANRLFNFREGYFRHLAFTSLDELAKQVKADLLDHLRGQSFEAQMPEIVGIPRIVIVEDIPEELDDLEKGFKARIQGAEVRGFDNGSQAVEHVKNAKPKPHFVVLDSRIPWLPPTSGGIESQADHSFGARTAQHINKDMRDEYCGGICLCGYSAFHDCASPSFRELVMRPVYEKTHLDQLLNWLIEDHVNRFIVRYERRLEWIDEIMLEFMQMHGGREVRPPFQDARDFIGRITTVDFDKSLLRSYLFGMWSQWSEDEPFPCDIPTLRLWEFRDSGSI